jgi:hypothetical protein
VPQPEARPVESEIGALERAGVIVLRVEWRRLFGSDPPRLSRDLLVRALAYRVQERALGGLSRASLKRLRELAENAEGRGPPPEQAASLWPGVVAWQCSVERETMIAENIEVEASHIGLGAHPSVIYAIADRLSQPEGAWKKFDRQSGLRTFFSQIKLCSSA